MSDFLEKTRRPLSEVPGLDDSVRAPLTDAPDAFAARDLMENFTFQQRPAELFQIVGQEVGDGCWAAVAQSVVNANIPGNAWTQCVIATRALGVNFSCCTFPGHCNRQHNLEVALHVVGCLRGGPVGVIEFGPLAHEVFTLGRVVPFRINLNSGHFVVVYRVYQVNGINHVTVGDPIRGTLDMNYATFKFNYWGLGGAATNTYFT